MLLQTLLYPEADRLVTIADAGGVGGARIDVTFGGFREIVVRSRSLQSAAATRSWQPTLTGHGEAERLDGQSAGVDYSRVLDVCPAIGRDFSRTDELRWARRRAEARGRWCAGDLVDVLCECQRPLGLGRGFYRIEGQVLFTLSIVTGDDRRYKPALGTA